MEITTILDAPSGRTALPPSQFPPVLHTALVRNETLAANLHEFLTDLDAVVGNSLEDLRWTDVTELEVSLTVSAEGRVSLLVGGAIGGDTAIRVTLRPRGSHDT